MYKERNFSSLFSRLFSVPDAPDVWVWINRDNTGQVIWKVIIFLFICVYIVELQERLFFSMGRMNLHLLFTSIFACQGCSVVVCIFKVLLSSPFFQPLTHRQSHGQIRAYEVTFWSHEENQQHSEIVSPNSFAASVNLSHFASFYGDRIIASVIAKNKDGESQPSSVLIPLRFTGMARPSLN